MQTQAPRFHWKRRAVQLATILLFVLIPASGLFRIDLVAGNFVVLDRQIWWSDFNLMLGFMLMLTAAGIVTYWTTGSVWCGWACPQNTLSEWANNLTHKLLGKHANVNIESDGLQVAAAKNKVLNWIILGVSFLAVSMVLGVVPFFYFFTPGEVWSFITFNTDSSLAQFMHRLYLVSVAAIFIDIAAIRYFWCDYACLYRFGQRFFKVQEALHVSYDASRSADCAKCNYCAASCIVGISPTRIKPNDTCINCGECIDACDRLHEKEGVRGLLTFRLANAGAQKGKSGWLEARTLWVGVIFLAGCGLFAYGLVNYTPYDIVAYRSEQSSGVTVSEYRVQLSNKMYQPAQLTLSAKGLPEGSYRFEPGSVMLAPASRQDAILHVSADLPKGLRRIIIEAQAADGWTGRFAVEHFTARN